MSDLNYTTADRRLPMPRKNTKQIALARMLYRPEGASMDEMVAETGWKPHTVRGALGGALPARLGIRTDSRIEPGRGRVYQIARPRFEWRLVLENPQIGWPADLVAEAEQMREHELLRRAAGLE